MKKRIISLLTTLVMVVGLVGVVPAVSVGAENSIYSDPYVFIADYLTTGAKVENNTYSTSYKNEVYYITGTNKDYFIWRELADEITDLDIIGANIWNNIDFELSADVYGLLNWQKWMYIDLLLDYMNYYESTSNFESSVIKDTEKYEYEIYEQLLNLCGSDENIQSYLQTMTVEQAMNMDLGFKVADSFNEMVGGVTTVLEDASDYFKTVSNYMTFKNINYSRIEFLKSIKDVSDDKYLCDAVDYLVEQYNATENQIQLTNLGQTLIEESSRQVGNIAIAALTDACPQLATALGIVKFGKAGIDFFFNATEISNMVLQLTVLRIMHTDIMIAYQKSRDNYISCSNSDNAYYFINSYDMYMTFNQYANDFCKDYLGEKLIDGYWNQLTDIFSHHSSAYSDMVTIIAGQNLQLNDYRNDIQNGMKLFFNLNWIDYDLTVFDNSSVAVTGIQFEKESVEWGTKDTFILNGKAKIIPSNANNKEIIYSSSNENVVKYINGEPRVQGGGTAKITATTSDGGYQAMLNVTVINGQGVDGIYLAPTGTSTEPIKESLKVGDTFTVGTLTYKVAASGEVEVYKLDTSAFSVNIPKYVSYNGYSYRVIGIRSGTFSNCNNLISITIPSSVTSIAYAFYGCSNLASIDVDVSNEKYSSLDGILFNKDKTELICYPAGKTNNSYNIPNNVLNIGDSAFYGCASLTGVSIPASVEEIGYHAFSQCLNLTTLTVATLDFKHDSSFYNVNIDKIIISDGVEIITKEMMSNSEISPQEVLIPNTVTNIGEGAFSGYTNLENIIIPNSVTYIGKSAFGNCTNLTNITIPNSITNIQSFTFEKCESLIKVTIPDGVVSIGMGAFYECNNLSTVTIPDSVTDIEVYAFDKCTNLKKVTVPIDIYSGYGFNDCSNIEEINYTKGRTGRMLDYTWYNYDYRYKDSYKENLTYKTDNLKKVTFEEGITYIGNYSFYWCDKLTDIQLPYSLEGIGFDAFTCCKSLTDISIPSSVKTIGRNAFDHCVSLTNITIPDNVTSIGNYAFGHCVSLINITIPDNVTSIGDGAFYGCTSLTSITIPESVTSIGYRAFYETPWLENKREENPLVVVSGILIDGVTIEGDIIIPNGVISIADNAFVECYNLTSITIPNSVINIGNNLFDVNTFITIKCYKNSCAEQYAKENNIYYELITDIILEDIDINGDGNISTADVGLINAHAKGTRLLSGEALEKADINKDGKVSTADVGLINAYAKGTKKYA